MSDIEFLVNDLSVTTQSDFDTDVHSLLDLLSGDGTEKNVIDCDPCYEDAVYHLLCPRDLYHDPNEAAITMETADAIDFYSMEVELSQVVKPTLKSHSIECPQLSLTCHASPEPNSVSLIPHTEWLTIPIAPEFNPSGYLPLQTMWVPQCQDAISLPMYECQHSPLGIQTDGKLLPFGPTLPPSPVYIFDEHRYTCGTPVNTFINPSTFSPAVNTATIGRVRRIASSFYDISKKKKLSKNTQVSVKQKKMKHRQPSVRFKKTLMQKRSDGERCETASPVVKVSATVDTTDMISWNENSDKEVGISNKVPTGTFRRSLETTPCKDSHKKSRKEPAPHTGMKLWQFLLKVLVEEQNVTVVHWISKENGTFCVSDPERLAKLWGKHKNRPEMNYDKLSRAVRYYYHKNLLDKIPKRLCYQFRYYSRWWEHLEMRADSQFKISVKPVPPVGSFPAINSLE